MPRHRRHRLDPDELDWRSIQATCRTGLLPGRPHIVISRTGFEHESERVHSAKSIEEAIQIARDITDEDEIFITGGGEIYKQTLPYIERLYLTTRH